MASKFTKEKFYKDLYISFIFDSIYCKNKKYDRLGLKKLKEEQNKKIEELLEEFGSKTKLEKAQDKYFEEEYEKYSLEELKEFLDGLLEEFKKYTKDEGCAKLLVAFYIDNILVDELEENPKWREEIKKNKEFQKYLLKILLEGMSNIVKRHRNRLSHGISKLYKIIGKELPEIESRDVYEYWEKFADEYIGDRNIDDIIKEVFGE